MNLRIQHDEIRKTHPVRLRKITYPTRASEDLLVQFESAVLTRCKGLVVLSKPLMGLTTAIRIAAAGWPVLHPDIPIVVVRSTGAGKFVAKDFWTSLVMQVAPSLAAWAYPEVLRHRLLRNFTTRALASKADRLLLVIDRAHTMLSEELSQIALFQDDLTNEGIDLIVALTGHESLRTKREALHDEARDEPVRRYFEKEHCFYGIKSAYDLNYFFESFDEDRFPAGSDWPISRFYFRDMFDRGWRLGHESPRAWSVMAGFAGVNGEPVEVEMQYVTETVCALLESAYEHGFEALSPDDDAWKISVQSSGLIPSRTLMSQLATPNLKGKGR